MDYLFTRRASPRHFQRDIAQQRQQMAEELGAVQVDKQRDATVNEIEGQAVKTAPFQE
jgi:hypothetical protein